MHLAPCRSLKAAYYLQKAGYQKVAYIQGGLAQWARDDLPVAEGAAAAAAAAGDESDGSADDESNGGSSSSSRGGSRMGTGFSSKSLKELVGTFSNRR